MWMSLVRLFCVKSQDGAKKARAGVAAEVVAASKDADATNAIPEGVAVAEAGNKEDLKINKEAKNQAGKTREEKIKKAENKPKTDLVRAVPAKEEVTAEGGAEITGEGTAGEETTVEAVVKTAIQEVVEAVVTAGEEETREKVAAAKTKGRQNQIIRSDFKN